MTKKRTHEEIRAILDGPDGDRAQHYWSLCANEPGLHKIIEQLLGEVEAWEKAAELFFRVGMLHMGGDDLDAFDTEEQAIAAFEAARALDGGE